MSKRTKIWLWIATVLVVVGCILFGGAASMLNWDLSTGKLVTREHTVNETYQNISITVDTADICFVPTDGEAKVVCCEQEKVRHSVSVQDGTLTVSVVDSRKWYEHIGIFFQKPSVTVYIPFAQFHVLTVSGSTGDVTIPKGFSFETVDIGISTGDVVCEAPTTGKLNIRTNTGDITVKNATAKAIELQVSTGRTTLANLQCETLVSRGNTGDIALTDVVASGNLTIERSTGDVKFDRCDAAEMEVTTDTGNVTGSLLTDKVFISKTDTGRINVPESVTGGKCKITTDTGNIKITIAE